MDRQRRVRSDPRRPDRFATVSPPLCHRRLNQYDPAPMLPTATPTVTRTFAAPLRPGALFAAFTAFVALLGPASAADRPNVLLIAVDDLRPELGCYGHPVVKTPHIDRLAREGTLFRRAYCQQALCAPSRASVLTGLRPDSSGITSLSQPVRQTLPVIRTLPEHFRAAGYTTLSLGKIYHHPTDDNDRGWSAPAWMPLGAWAQAVDPANGPLEPKGRSTTWERVDVPDTAYPDGKIAARARTELARFKKTGEPFFLAVGFLKPHLPFFAPKKYWDLYAPGDIRMPDATTWPAGMPALAGTNWEELRQYRGAPKQGPLDPELARTLVHGYYACVSYVDAMIGEVLAELEQQGLRQNTIVVLFGDHGWKLGEYGAWCKHTNFELDTRSPLIVSAPSRRAAGQPSNALVEFVDLYPTLAELCGLDVPAHCEGDSFVPLLDSPARPWKAAAFSLYPRGNLATGFSVRDERWRYTEWIDPRTHAVVARELYDHADSVVATTNLADDPAHGSEVARLGALLDGGRGWRHLRRASATVPAAR